MDVHWKVSIMYVPYSGKVWREENLANLANCSWFAKLKPSKLVLTINYLLVDLLIRQTFFHQMLEKSWFTKLSSLQTFLLCGIWSVVLQIWCLPILWNVVMSFQHTCSATLDITLTTHYDCPKIIFDASSKITTLH